MEKKYVKKCVSCGEQFETNRYYKKYCSEPCRKASEKHRHKPSTNRDNFSHGTIYVLKNMDEPMENWVWTKEIRHRKEDVKKAESTVNMQVMYDKLVPVESEEVDYSF
jgi:hypothetical protein